MVMFSSSSSPRRSILSGLLLCAFSLILVSHAFAQDSDTSKRGRKYKPPPPTSHVEVTVVRATTGKPIENASVIFHPLQDGKNAGNMELKTNDEGKTTIDLLALGSDVRLQIIAPGFQTYGEDYKIDKDNIALEIKMQRPGAQYSIYKKGEGKVTQPGQRPNTSSADAPKPDESKPVTPKPDAAKPDAPKDTTPEAKPEEAKPQDSTTPPQSN
jgi:hypothetical protein